jgi:hypothetical protein
MAYELIGLPPENGVLKPVCLLDKHENKPIEDYPTAEKLKAFCESVMGCKGVFIRTVIDIEDLNKPFPFDNFTFFDV